MPDEDRVTLYNVVAANGGVFGLTFSDHMISLPVHQAQELLTNWTWRLASDDEIKETAQPEPGDKPPVNHHRAAVKKARA